MHQLPSFRLISGKYLSNNTENGHRRNHTWFNRATPGSPERKDPTTESEPDSSSHTVEGRVCLVLARFIMLCWLPGVKKHSEDAYPTPNNTENGHRRNHTWFNGATPGSPERKDPTNPWRERTVFQVVGYAPTSLFPTYFGQISETDLGIECYHHDASCTLIWEPTEVSVSHI
jgi:hypothetical protein